MNNVSAMLGEKSTLTGILKPRIIISLIVSLLLLISFNIYGDIYAHISEPESMKSVWIGLLKIVQLICVNAMSPIYGTVEKK